MAVKTSYEDDKQVINPVAITSMEGGTAVP